MGRVSARGPPEIGLQRLEEAALRRDELAPVEPVLRSDERRGLTVLSVAVATAEAPAEDATEDRIAAVREAAEEAAGGGQRAACSRMFEEDSKRLAAHRASGSSSTERCAPSSAAAS